MKPMLFIRYTFRLILIVISLLGFSQKEANIWYFGYEAGLDFNSGDPVTLTNSAINQPEGCASISDSGGNILFYTNEMDVWDKSHSIMANGSGLMGEPSSSQSGIIVPKPESNSIYYIFTVPQEIGSTGLRYSVVDLTLNGGLGAITSKNIFLIEPTEEKVTAVKHANNNDIWVITHLWNSDAFYCYLVTSEGVNTTPVISKIGTYHSGVQGDSHGCMKASPNGNKLGIIVRCIDSFELFDFDNESGQILSPITFPSVFNTPYGIEFSLDCSRLYISDYGSGSKIYQYNLEAGSPSAIINSKIQVGSVSTSHIRSLQLAPNEKIYVSNNNYTQGNPYLSVINNPTILGTGCNFEENALYLAGKKCVFGLPNFIQTYFDQVQDFNFFNTCFNDTTFFHISFQGVDSVSDTGAYWVNVFDGQCYNTNTINIEHKNCDLFIPNVFTPNDDGYNNYFYTIVSKDITDFNLVVFNRWTEKVWETDKPDGKRNGHPAAEGTYFWVVKYTCPGSPETQIKEG